MSRLDELVAELIQIYGLPSDTRVRVDQVDEEKCWEDALRDYDSGDVRVGLRAKLFTELAGDQLRTKIEFIKTRALELIEVRTQQSLELVRASLEELQAKKIAKEQLEAARSMQLARQDALRHEADSVLLLRRECQPFIDRLKERRYEVVKEVVLPQEQSWTLRSTTNGITFEVGSVEELRKLVF